MKRIIYALLIFILAFTFVGSTLAFAEEVETDVTEDALASLETTGEAAEEHTIFTRLYEAFTDNKTDVFTISGSSILLVISLILRKDLGSSSKKIVDHVASVLSKANVSDEKQTAIVKGLNEMIDGYNEIKQSGIEAAKQIEGVASEIKNIAEANVDSFEKVEKVIGVMTNLMEKVIQQNSEVMEVLAAVYINNNALPKGIKDYVSIQRTENAKIVAEASTILHSKEEGVSNE